MSELETAVLNLVRAELLKPRTPEEVRILRGFTLEELATRVGTSKATLSRIERGVCKYPNEHILQRCAVELNCAEYPILAARARP